MDLSTIKYLPALVVALLVDAVVAPLLLTPLLSLRLMVAVVALVGMKRGPVAGALTGWCAAVLLSGLTFEPLGLSMLTLGVTGYAGGLLAKPAALGLPFLDVLLVVALLALEDVLACAVNRLAFGLPIGLHPVSVVVTGLLVFAALSWRAASRRLRGESL